MQVQCPGCGTSGNINEATIPDEGKSLKCPKCGQVFLQKRAASRDLSAGQGGAISAPISANHIIFYGSGASLFVLQFVNLLLSIATLGFYRFWGKAKVRNYLYARTELGGDTFEYHGTGKELLIGWIKAMIVLGIGYASVTGLRFINPFFSILVLFAIPPMMGFAKVGSMRYRFSRSSWRGIRFSFRGNFWEGIGIYTVGMILTAVTLGLYYPFFHTKLRRFIVGGSYYGNQRLTYNGRGKELFPAFILALFLSFISLGIYWFWFKARLTRYDWEKTDFPGSRFSSDVTGANVLSFFLTNLFLFIFTLGLAFPWITVRRLEFRFKHLSISSDFRLENVRQDIRTAKAGGEAISDYLDIDGAFFEIGLI